MRLKLHPIGIYGCIIQQIIFPALKKIKKYAWQKDHKENKTGTNERYKPIKIAKVKVNKNMNHGIIINFFLSYFFDYKNFIS